MVDLAALTQAIEVGDRAAVASLARDAVAAGLPPQTILDSMTSAMQVVGGRFQRTRSTCPRCSSPPAQ
jgi:methanogenic corrinoid protein MtbC1